MKLHIKLRFTRKKATYFVYINHFGAFKQPNKNVDKRYNSEKYF